MMHETWYLDCGKSMLEASNFIHWVEEIFSHQNDEMLSHDGDVIRNSHAFGPPTIHLVSTYGSGLVRILGQTGQIGSSTKAKTIPALLEALLLDGVIITIDAMGCQQSIARQIVESGADYVLAVKANQPTLLAHIRDTFDAIERVRTEDQDAFATIHYEVSKNKGQIETRRYVASDILTRGHRPGIWPGMRSILMVESHPEAGLAGASQRHYFVSSLSQNAHRIARAVRSHWSVGHKQHWCLDVALGEDQCRVCVADAAQNIAILRRIVTNLIKQDFSVKGALHKSGRFQVD
ncbi:ISAs1 family transposase [Paraburkholderia heleia]|uniref:ISAs1 family transposase n=1 Tax=Paraburkholderia heleia TaxID=634127 RepID=UPI002AB62B4E|nr:ISAs1 family transposase [Paraburkholderia heleia]